MCLCSGISCLFFHDNLNILPLRSVKIAATVVSGERGSFFANTHEAFFCPVATLKTPVVDTTGAGDAFNAGLAVGLAENMSVREAMAFASATAGLSTTKIGTAKAMPNREQIEECLGGK